MRYIAYCRKSSEQDERQALSIESQRNEIKRKFPELNIVDFFEESRSAFIPDYRTKFAQMIDMIKSAEADGIIAWHPDRLSRNEVDASRITYLVRTGVIKDLKFGSYNFDNSPEGIMMLQIALSQSQYSSSKLSVDVKRGLKTKAEKGWLPSGAKPGYMNDKYAEKGNKTIHKDPERFPLIRKAWDLMLSGLYTPPEILNRLNNEWGYRTLKHRRIGGKPMSRSMIYLVFIDPFYYGWFEYPVGSGSWYKGNHEQMVTKEEFDRVQILLGRGGVRRPQTHEFPYTGLMRCGECDAMITAEEKWQVICSKCKLKFASLNRDFCPKCMTLISNMDNPTILHYIYYHCTKRKSPKCTQGYLSVKEFEKQLDRLLSKVQISERFKNWAVKYLHEMNEKEIDDRNAIIDSLQSAYKDCLTRIDNLVKLYTSPKNTNEELLSSEEFKSQKEPLLKEKQGLEERLKDTGERVSKWVELSEKTFNFACYARHWLKYGDTEKKREVLYGIGSNLILLNKTLRVDLEDPLEYIEEAREEVVEISPMFEPKEKAYTTAQLETLWSQNPSLLLGQDSNLRPIA